MTAALAAAPLLAVLAAMGMLGWSAARAGAAGLVAAALLAVTAFPLERGTAPGAAAAALGVGAEAGHAALSILWIVLPALTLYEYQDRTGGLARIRAVAAGLTSDRRLQILLIAWFFGLFMEGAAGFGTPVALAAPLLVGVGVPPVQAVALALLGHAVGVTFGALGAPPLAQIAIAGLAPGPLAAATAGLGLAAGAALLAALTWQSEASRPRARDAAWALAAGLCFLLPYAAIARFAGPELPTLGGAFLGFLAFLALMRAAGEATPAPTRGLAADLAPYAALVALVLATRLIPPLREALSEVTLDWRLYGAFSASVAPLMHPGTALAVCLALTAAASGRLDELWTALGAALRRLAPVALALAVMLLLSRLMVHAGMIDALAEAAAGAGAAWPLLAPAIGALGTFVTGSATASSVLFVEFQTSTAEALGLSPTLMAAAQGVGGAVGNVVAPHNIIAGCATVGLVRREGEILRRTAPAAAACLLAAGAAAALAAG
ncbi:MAG: L-lactate permease [Pseudomonadota bacterium]